MPLGSSAHLCPAGGCLCMPVVAFGWAWRPLSLPCCDLHLCPSGGCLFARMSRLTRGLVCLLVSWDPGTAAVSLRRAAGFAPQELAAGLFALAAVSLGGCFC